MRKTTDRYRRWFVFLLSLGFLSSSCYRSSGAGDPAVGADETNRRRSSSTLPMTHVPY